jgi:polyisoprenoid-binding protein YceI
METDKYPYSTFQGKIIEQIDKNVKGKQSVRAKGILSIHGVEKERIINANLEFVNDSFVISSKFEIPLEDHNIRVPSIVHQKIAENITVEVNTTLLPKKSDN